MISNSEIKIQRFLRIQTENKIQEIEKKFTSFDEKSKEKIKSCELLESSFIANTDCIFYQIKNIDRVLPQLNINICSVNNTQVYKNLDKAIEENIKAIENAIDSFIDLFKSKMIFFYKEKEISFECLGSEVNQEFDSCKTVYNEADISPEFEELYKKNETCKSSLDDFSKQFHSTITHQSGQYGKNSSNSNIGDIKNLVGNLNQTIRLLEKNSNYIKQLVDDIKCIETKATTIKSYADNICDDVKKFTLENTTFDSIKTNLGNYGEKLRELQEQSYKIQIDSNALFSIIPQKIGLLVNTLKAAKIKVIQKLTKKIEKDLNIFIVDLKQKMSEIDNKISNLYNRVQSIQNINNIKDNFDLFKNLIDNLNVQKTNNESCLGCLKNYKNDYDIQLHNNAAQLNSDICINKNDILLNYSDIISKKCYSLIQNDMKKFKEDVTVLGKNFLNASDFYTFQYISSIVEIIKKYLNDYQLILSIINEISEFVKKEYEVKNANNSSIVYSVSNYNLDVIKDIHDKIYSILKASISNDINDRQQNLKSEKDKIDIIRVDMTNYLNVANDTINYNSILKQANSYTKDLKEKLEELSTEYSKLKSKIENILNCNPVYLNTNHKRQIQINYNSFNSNITGNGKYILNYSQLNKKIENMLGDEAKKIIQAEIKTKNITLITKNINYPEIDEINLIIRNLEATKILNKVREFIDEEEGKLDKCTEININRKTIVYDCKKTLKNI